MTRATLFVIIAFLSLNYPLNGQINGTETYLPDELVEAVYQSEDGLIWVSTGHSTLYSLDGRNVQYISAPPYSKIHQIVDFENELLLCTNSGLFTKSGSEWIRWKEDRPFSAVYKVLMSDDGLILATGKGIWIYHPEDDNYTSLFGRDDDRDFINLIRIGDQYFAATDREIVQWDNEFQSKSISSETGIMQLANAREMQLLVLSEEGKLYVLLDQQLKQYVLPGFDQSMKISHVLNHNPFLLISTEKNGLYYWDYKDYHIKKITGVQDIFETITDSWGNLWLATQGGLIKVEHPAFKTSMPPYIKITGLHTNERELDGYVLDTIQLRPTEKMLRIDFQGIDQGNKNSLQFQYRLDAESEWSAPTPDEFVLIGDLSPGPHEIQVRGTTDQVYYGYSDTVSLYVNSKLLFGFWPYVFAGIGILSGLWLWSYFKMVNSSRKWQEDRKKLVLENKLLQTERKVLQQQMNPHFIFNALQSIQGLLACQQIEKAREYLQSFSRLLRSMLEQARHEKISLEDEISYLKNYLEIEKLNNHQKFEYSFHTDDVDMEIEIPSMLIQPILENAIKHGLKKEGTRIILKIDELNDHILAIVEDNGEGRKSKDHENHQSYGTVLIKDRIRQYGSQLNGGELRYEDLVDEQGLPAGTRVYIRIPILG